MSPLVSSLSAPVTVTISASYTNANLVSEITGGEVLPSEILPEWIEQAVEEVDRRAGMCFQPIPFTDELDGNGLDTVFTRCFPLIDVTQVTIDGIVLPSTLYVVNKRTGSIRLKEEVFSIGARNVVVTGTEGQTKVPPLIQKIASLLVAKTALSAKNGPLVDSESIGNFTQSRTFKKLNDELDRAWAAWGKRFPIDFV